MYVWKKFAVLFAGKEQNVHKKLTPIYNLNKETWYNWNFWCCSLLFIKFIIAGCNVFGSSKNQNLKYTITYISILFNKLFIIHSKEVFNFSVNCGKIFCMTVHIKFIIVLIMSHFNYQHSQDMELVTQLLSSAIAAFKRSKVDQNQASHLRKIGVVECMIQTDGIRSNNEYNDLGEYSDNEGVDLANSSLEETVQADGFVDGYDEVEKNKCQTHAKARENQANEFIVTFEALIKCQDRLVSNLSIEEPGLLNSEDRQSVGQPEVPQINRSRRKRWSKSSGKDVAKKETKQNPESPSQRASEMFGSVREKTGALKDKIGDIPKNPSIWHQIGLELASISKEYISAVEKVSPDFEAKSLEFLGLRKETKNLETDLRHWKKHVFYCLFGNFIIQIYWLIASLPT